MVPFNIFMSQLKETNATLEFFTDFKKVSLNVSKVSMKLNQLNYLLGKENLEESIRLLYLLKQKSTVPSLKVCRCSEKTRNVLILSSGPGLRPS